MQRTYADAKHTRTWSGHLRARREQHGPAVAFLHMAVDIAGYHHERYDGKGYPDRLSSTEIPLAARIVAVTDVYDAFGAPVAPEAGVIICYYHTDYDRAVTWTNRSDSDQGSKAMSEFFERTFVELWIDRVSSDWLVVYQANGTIEYCSR